MTPNEQGALLTPGAICNGSTRRGARPAGLLFLIAFCCSAFTTSGFAATDSGAPGFRGFAADIDGFHASRWSYSDPIDPNGGFRVLGRPGLGLRISYAPSKHLAPYVAMHLITHDWGRQNGTYGSVGMQLRRPWTRRVMPFANLGVGHIHDRSVAVSYDFIEIGGGVQLFISGRMAFHPVLEIVRPLGDGKRELGGGQTRDVSLDVSPWRTSFGLTWFMGKRTEDLRSSGIDDGPSAPGTP